MIGGGQQRLDAAPSGRRAWLILLTKFASTQALVQAVGVLVGLAIIRHLDKSEYGQYSIAVAVQSGLIVLGDSGLTGAVLTFAAQKSADQAHLALVRRAATRLRRRIVAIVSVPVCAWLLWALAHNGVGNVQTLLIVASVLITLQVTLVSSLQRVSLEASGRFSLVQRALLGSAFARVAIVEILCLSTTTPVYFVAANIVGSMFEVGFYRRWLSAGNERNLGKTDELDAAMFRYASKAFPLSAFIVLVSQLTPIILASSGMTESVANISAILRFAAIFTILTTTASGVIVPRFSQVFPIARARRLYLLIVGSFTLAVMTIWLILVVARSILLRLLGPAYSNLAEEYAILCGGAALYSVVALMNSLNQSRGWVERSWIYIPITVTWFSFAYLTLDLRTSVGAALFASIAFVPGVIVELVRAHAGMRSEARFGTTRGASDG